MRDEPVRYGLKPGHLMAKFLDQILVVDVEATCWDGAPPVGQVSEIIQIGVCPVDVRRLDRCAKRSILVKPVRSAISAFCSEMTGLTPEMFQEAGPLANAVRVLRKEHQSQDRLWASWGDYDRRQFERVCKDAGVPYPFGPSHLNVKSLFAVARNLEHEVGLDGAFVDLGMTMEGRHHRGDDDAWNIAHVLCLLLRRMRAAGQNDR